MAAGGTDGSLKFDTKIDTSGFDGGMSSLGKAVERLSKAIDNLSERIAQGFGTAGNVAASASAGVDSVGSAAEKSEVKVKSLQEQMDAIEFHDMEETPVSDTSLPQRAVIEDPDKYGYDKSALKFMEECGDSAAKAAEHVNEFKQALEESKAKVKELQSQGFYLGDDEYEQALLKYERLKREEAEYKNALFNPPDDSEAQYLDEISRNAQVGSQEIIELTHRMEELKARQKELASAGVTTGYAEYDANYAEIAAITAQINEYKKSISEAGGHTSTFAMTAKNAFSVAAVAVAGFAKKIGQNLAGKIKQVVSNLRKLGKASNGVSKSILKLSSMFKLMLIRMAMRAAIQGVKEGMENLVQYSDNANQSMSNLMSGMTYLKNSFAAAFAPILSIVAPILNTLINLLATAIGYINQFFAALGGGTTFVRAKKANQDYAKSLKATGGAAKSAGKEAKKALAPFDDLVQIQRESDASGGGGGGGAAVDPADMFETAAVSQGISDFVNQLKDLWAAGDWEGIGQLIGTKINEAVLRFTEYISWDNVGRKITSFVTAFTAMFNSLVATIDWYAIGIMMGTGINTLANTLYLLLTQIDWLMLGNAVSQGLMGLVDTVDWNLFGATIGAYFQAKISGLLGFIIGTDWGAIGAALATCIMGLTGQINWEQLGYLLAAGLNGAFSFLLQFAVTYDWSGLGRQISTGISTVFQTFDWAQAGDALSRFVLGILDFLIVVVQETDWNAFVQGIVDCIEAIDWIGLAGNLFTLFYSALGVAFGALANLLGTLIADGVVAAKEYFQGKIEECGGNVVLGILKGISDAFAGIKEWIVENIFMPFFNGVLAAFGIDGTTSSELKAFGEYLWNGFTDGVKQFFANPGDFIKNNITDPFIKGVKNLLGIHSPSTVMAEMGQYLWDGFCNGVKEFFSDPGAFIKANITDPFVNGIKNLLGIHSPSTVLKEIGGNTVTGFNQGVEGGQSSTQSVVQSWAKGVASWFSQKLGISGGNSTEAQQWADSTMTGYNTTVSKNYVKSRSVMETWADNVRKWFVASGTEKGVNKESWIKFADDVIKAFADEVTSKHTDTQEPAETWADNVRKWFTGDSEAQGINEQSWTKFARNIIEAFKTKIEGSHSETQSPMETWAKNVKEWFWGDSSLEGTGGLYDAFFNMARRINEGFAEGIHKFSYMAKSAIREWAREAMEEAEEEFDINSPSREFRTIAEYVVRGFNAGITDMARTSRNVVQEWLDGVLDVFDGVEVQLPIGINIPNAASYLPRMASGTVVPPRAGELSAGMRSAGGYSPEEMLGHLITRMDEMISRMRSSGDQPMQIVLNLTGNMAALARVLKPELDKEAARKGVSLVIVGGA